MPAHESQGISIHCICRNNESEKHTITKVKSERGTRKIWRSWFSFSFLDRKSKAFIYCKTAIKKQYLERSKGKNFRKSVWKRSYKKWEFILYKFKPWLRGKTKNSVRLQQCAARYFSSINITFALVLHFFLSSIAYHQEHDDTMDWPFMQTSTIILYSHITYTTCWTWNTRLSYEIYTEPHLGIIFFIKICCWSRILVLGFCLLQNGIKKLNHKNPTFLTPQNPELLS